MNSTQTASSSTMVDFSQAFPQFLIQKNTAGGILALNALAPYNLEIELIALRGSTLVDIVTFTRQKLVGTSDSTMTTTLIEGSKHSSKKNRKDYSALTLLPQQVILKGLDDLMISGTIGCNKLPSYEYFDKKVYDRSYYSSYGFSIDRSITYLDIANMDTRTPQGRADQNYRVWQYVTMENANSPIYRSRFKFKVDALLTAAMSDFDTWIASLLFYNNMAVIPYSAAQIQISDTDKFSITPFRRYIPQSVSFEKSLNMDNAMNTTSVKIPTLKSALNSSLRALGSLYPTGYMENLDDLQRDFYNDGLRHFKEFFDNLNITDAKILSGRNICAGADIATDVLDCAPSIVSATQNSFGIPFSVRSIEYKTDAQDQQPVAVLSLQASTIDLNYQSVGTQLGKPLQNASLTGYWFLGDQANTASLKYWLDKKFDIALNIPVRVANKNNFSPLNYECAETGFLHVNVNPKYTVSGTLTSAGTKIIQIVVDARQLALKDIEIDPGIINNKEYKYEPNVDLYLTTGMINQGVFKGRSSSLPQFDYLALAGTVGTLQAPVPLNRYLIDPSYRVVFAVADNAIIINQTQKPPTMSPDGIFQEFKEMYQKASIENPGGDGAVDLLQSQYERECNEIFNVSEKDKLQNLTNEHSGHDVSFGASSLLDSDEPSTIESITAKRGSLLGQWSRLSKDYTKYLLARKIDLKALLERPDLYKVLLQDTHSLINIDKLQTLQSFLGIFATYRQNLPTSWLTGSSTSSSDKDVIIGVNAAFNADINLNLGATMKIFTGKVTTLENVLPALYMDNQQHSKNKILLEFLDLYRTTEVQEVSKETGRYEYVRYFNVCHDFINTGWRLGEFLVTGLVKIKQLRNMLQDSEFGIEVHRLLYVYLKYQKTHTDEHFTAAECVDFYEALKEEAVSDTTSQNGRSIQVSEECALAINSYLEKFRILHEVWILIKDALRTGAFLLERSCLQNIDILKTFVDFLRDIDAKGLCSEADFFMVLRLLISEEGVEKYLIYRELFYPVKEEKK